jgi:quercetin dioxygenase-like cupin family protein
MSANDLTLWFLDGLVRVRAAGRPGGVSVLEHEARLGDSPPLHDHRDDDEVFQVLDGRLRLQVGDDELTAGPGDVLTAPRGVPHSYVVETERARWLVITPGDGFERFVVAASRPAETDDLPEPTPVTPELAEGLGRLAAAHGIDLVGPPLALAAA